MKKEMKMMPNGNYEEVISPIQHECRPDCDILCVQYGYESGKLHLIIESGDPYEDGCSHEFLVKFCPFCGYECKN